MQTLHALFDWMLDVSLRASLLSAAVILVQLALRGHLPARWRYALWLPVLLVLILPVLPESRWSVENLVVAHSPVPPPFVMPHVPVEAAPVSAAPAVTAAPVSVRPIDWKEMIVFIWLAGWVVSLAAGTTSYLLMLRRFRRTAVAASLDLAAKVESLSRDLRIHAPQILLSEAVESPAVACLLRPVLLLPLTFAERFSPDEAELVLKHELMHLRRRDLPVNAVLCFLQAMHWFNPVLWFAAARARQDREAACDAQVLASEAHDRRNDYGHALLKVESACAPRGFSIGFVGMFQRGQALRSRIKAIAGYRSPNPLMGLVVATLVITLTVLGATRAATSSNPKDDAERISVEIRLIDIKTVPGKDITLTPATQACAVADVKGEHHGGPLLISALELHALEKALGAQGIKPVTYPRMVTFENKPVLIGSVVNQPVLDAGKIAYLSFGTLCNFTPKKKAGGGLEVDCDVSFSETRDKGSYKRLEKTTSLAEAEKEIVRLVHKQKIEFKEGQTALISMKRADTAPGVLKMIAITPAVHHELPAETAEEAATAAIGAAFEVGQTSFPHGDSIRIAAVQRLDDVIKITGDYELVSQQQAVLDLGMTSKVRGEPGAAFDPRQRKQVGKGRGRFTLMHPVPYVGLPRVTFYTLGNDGSSHPFGRVFFGSREEADASQKTKLDHYELAAQKPGKAAAPAMPSMEEKLNNIVIPRLKFVDARLSEVFDYLQTQGRNADPTKAVTVITRLDDTDPTTKVSFTMENVTLGDALRKYAELANLKMRVTPYGVLITRNPGAPAPPQPVETAKEALRASKIILPTVEFRDATLEEGIAFFRQQALKHDPDKKGVTLVVKGDPAAMPKITISLIRVPLIQALRYVAELGGYKVETGDEAITLVPKWPK